MAWQGNGQGAARDARRAAYVNEGMELYPVDPAGKEGYIMSLGINTTGSFYNNYKTDTATDSAGKLEETLNSDLSQATEEELMDVCKDFEAYFIEQMFKAMQKMVPESEENVSASTKQLKDYYKEQMTQSYAEQASESGGLGIAQVLYEQMKRNYGLE